MSDEVTLFQVMELYPHVWPFLFTPGFLDMAVSTHHFRCGYELRTMTGLILKKLLKKANDPLIGQKYISIVDAVKKLTYNNLKQHQWFTGEKDLQDHGLTEKDVVSTGIMNEIEGPNRTLDYCCRFEQEFYAGCYTLHMDKDEFLEFTTEVATRDSFLIPTAVACGLLFDDVVRRKVRVLGTAPQRHLDCKREMIAEFFSKECKRRPSTPRISDLYTMMFEGQKAMQPIIRKNLYTIKMEGNISPFYQVLANSFLVQQSLILEAVTFIQCGMNERKVNLFHQYVFSSEVRFASIDVSHNSALTPECMYLLAKCVVRCRCRILIADDCGLTVEHIIRLAAGIGDGKMDGLHLSCNKGLGTEGMYHLGKLVGNALVVNLTVTDCELGDEEWKKFFEGLAAAEAATGPKVRVLATWGIPLSL